MGSIGLDAKPTGGLPAFDIKRIAIIGAGPSGIAAAKHLLAEGFKASQIDVFEQRDEVGGVWNYTSLPPTGPLPVPQTDAFPPPDPPVFEGDDEDDDYESDDCMDSCCAPGSGACSLPSLARVDRRAVFPGPMYENLNTNIPHTLMRYSDKGFTSVKEDCEIFPPRQIVMDYLKEYARDIRHLVSFATQVMSLTLLAHRGASLLKARVKDQWELVSLNLLNNVQRKQVYDAVVVASGHYSTPYIPLCAEGMTEFAATHPSIISHCKGFRSASAFAGKKVIVVGSGPSGLDIASQIRDVCAPPLIMSARSPVADDMSEHLGVGGKVRLVGQITRFLIEERGVEVQSAPGSALQNGKTTQRITDIDAILFCTGYLYTYPFLDAKSLSPSAPPLITDGRRVHGIARHFIHNTHPSLVFPALPIKVIPFPLAEGQAAVMARLWNNRLPLPSRKELESWEREDEQGKGFEGERAGKGKAFHIFPKGGDAKYINAFHEWAAKATDRDDEKGKEPPFWGDEELWQRSVYAQARMLFEKGGCKAKTLEELGLRYEPHAKSTPSANGTRDQTLDIAG
ncbi:FAD/NAD(P)-binding domain-containing protein [Xylariaceae sp. FL1272]|nr:FAD/NAD(P)-binding domain-containing protein [Xylariaceae sp. FL1272]